MVMEGNHEVKVGVYQGVSGAAGIVSLKNVLLLAVLVVGLGTWYMLHSVLGDFLGYQERCVAFWMVAMKTWASMAASMN